MTIIAFNFKDTAEPLRTVVEDWCVDHKVHCTNVTEEDSADGSVWAEQSTHFTNYRLENFRPCDGSCPKDGTSLFENEWCAEEDPICNCPFCWAVVLAESGDFENANQMAREHLQGQEAH